MNSVGNSYEKEKFAGFRFPTMTSGDWDKRQNALR